MIVGGLLGGVFGSQAGKAAVARWPPSWAGLWTKLIRLKRRMCWRTSQPPSQPAGLIQTRAINTTCANPYL
jgi:hypothetical protein